MGLHARRPRPHHRGRPARAATSSTTSASATSGTSRPGIPHSIQGLGDGCEFLLVFDDGAFSENETFLHHRLVRAHAARRAGQELRRRRSRRSPTSRPTSSTSATSSTARCPAPLAPTRVAPAGAVPDRFSHRLLAQEPIQVAGGQVRIVDSSNFPRRAARSPPRSSRSSRAACASCTGTRTPTSGSTTSRAAAG